MQQLYNEHGTEYEVVKGQAWRTRIELFSLMQVIGPFSGTAIDMATGNGWLAKEVAKTAQQVLGIDISEKMIADAKSETAGVGNLDFEVGDGKNVNIDDPADLVTSNWYLVNARTEEELEQMIRGLAQCLKPGGRMVSLVNDPKIFERPISDRADYAKYGFQARLPPDRAVVEGDFARMVVFNEDGDDFEVDNFYFSKATHNRLLEKYFCNIKWHGLELSPSSQDEGDYWNLFLEKPLMTIITAEKKQGQHK